MNDVVAVAEMSLEKSSPRAHWVISQPDAMLAMAPELRHAGGCGLHQLQGGIRLPSIPGQYHPGQRSSNFRPSITSCRSESERQGIAEFLDHAL